MNTAFNTISETLIQQHQSDLQDSIDMVLDNVRGQSLQEMLGCSEESMWVAWAES